MHERGIDPDQFHVTVVKQLKVQIRVQDQQAVGHIVQGYPQLRFLRRQGLLGPLALGDIGVGGDETTIGGRAPPDLDDGSVAHRSLGDMGFAAMSAGFRRLQGFGVVSVAKLAGLGQIVEQRVIRDAGNQKLLREMPKRAGLLVKRADPHDAIVEDDPLIHVGQHRVGDRLLLGQILFGGLEVANVE